LHRGPWHFSGIHRYALGSHLGPWKDWKTRNWVPGGRPPAALPDFGEVAAGVGGERVGEALWLTYGSICVLGGGRETVGKGGRRHQAAAAAGAFSPASGAAPAACGYAGGLTCGTRERVVSSEDGGVLHGAELGDGPQWSMAADREEEDRLCSSARGRPAAAAL
jgi:hypothetical protein